MFTVQLIFLFCWVDIFLRLYLLYWLRCTHTSHTSIDSCNNISCLSHSHSILSHSICHILETYIMDFFFFLSFFCVVYVVFSFSFHLLLLLLFLISSNNGAYKMQKCYINSFWSIYKDIMASHSGYACVASVAITTTCGHADLSTSK